MLGDFGDTESREADEIRGGGRLAVLSQMASLFPGAFLPSVFTLFSVKLTALLFIRVSSLRMCEYAHAHSRTRVSSYTPHTEDQETCFTGTKDTFLEIITFWLVIANMRAVKTFILRLMINKVRHMLKQVKQRDTWVQLDKHSDSMVYKISNRLRTSRMLKHGSKWEKTH